MARFLRTLNYDAWDAALATGRFKLPFLPAIELPDVADTYDYAGLNYYDVGTLNINLTEYDDFFNARGVGENVVVNVNAFGGDDKIDVSDDGSFYAVVRLKQEGVNRVHFVAQDNAGNERREDREAYIESY